MVNLSVILVNTAGIIASVFKFTFVEHCGQMAKALDSQPGGDGFKSWPGYDVVYL